MLSVVAKEGEMPFATRPEVTREVGAWVTIDAEESVFDDPAVVSLDLASRSKLSLPLGLE